MRRLLAVILFLSPAPALANCTAAGAPSYQDITYLNVKQFALVGASHPRYEFEATAFPRAASRPARFDASLSARRAVPYIGSFVAANPRQTFEAVSALLERNRFFDMRMTSAQCCVVDGPEDSITVIRCNVTTTLATVSKGGSANLDDPHGRAFLGLEDQLRRTIFAQKWIEPAAGSAP